MKKIFLFAIALACALCPPLVDAQTYPTPTFNTITLQNPLTVPNGGIGTGTASGTALDNISGFSGTGFLTRTGSGAYSFQSLTNGITLGNLAQAAANTVLANATGSTANVSAFSMPSCSTSVSALNWTSGTGFTCQTITNANLGANPIALGSPKDIYVSTAGNDSNSGTSWGLAKLTLQAAVNALSGGAGGTVHVANATYSLTSTLTLQPNVLLSCVKGATIMQAAGANLSSIIDWSTNTANGAGIENCIIDGNRSNNTDNAGVFMLYASTANDILLRNNTIQNGNGYGVDVSTGLRPIIAYNKWSNFYTGPIYIVTGVGQTQTLGQIVGNVITGNIGQHAITLNNSDRNIVSGNNITAALQTGTVVNTSGTTVTWVSGPNFSSVAPGSFIIFNGGTELLVTAVNSSTSITVNASAGTLTSVPAAFGPGDLISVLSASHNVISNNEIFGGVGGGIVISNFVAGSSTQKNQVIGNSLRGQGEGCIELESENAFSTQVFDNQIRGNSISNCGVGGTAVASNTQYGIALIDFNPNTLLNTFIDGNYIRDDQGTATTQNWLGITSVGVGQVFVGKNTNVGTVNNGVAGGISSVTLSAGWGSTASTSAVTSYGDGFVLTVTSSGTGQSASPSVTVNTRATTSNNPPVLACQDIGGTGTAQFVIGQIPGINTSASLSVFVFNGTPVAGNTYIFLCRG